MKLRFVLAFAVALFVGALSSAPAQAAPVLGAQLTYTGGTVTVESLPVTSGFTSELGLYDSTFTLLQFLMLDEPSGVTVTFDPSALGVGVGGELIFGIRVQEDGNKYFMGPGSRNPDGVIHAGVDTLGGGQFVVGFEDLFGGGDRDYDDNKFTFTGGLNASVPEPGLLGLLALGFGSLVRRRFSTSAR